MYNYPYTDSTKVLKILYHFSAVYRNFKLAKIFRFLNVNRKSISSSHKCFISIFVILFKKRRIRMVWKRYMLNFSTLDFFSFHDHLNYINFSNRSAIFVR